MTTSQFPIHCISYHNQKFNLDNNAFVTKLNHSHSCHQLSSDTHILIMWQLSICIWNKVDQFQWSVMASIWPIFHCQSLYLLQILRYANKEGKNINGAIIISVTDALFAVNSVYVLETIGLYALNKVVIGIPIINLRLYDKLRRLIMGILGPIRRYLLGEFIFHQTKENQPYIDWGSSCRYEDICRYNHDENRPRFRKYVFVGVIEIAFKLLNWQIRFRGNSSGYVNVVVNSIFCTSCFTQYEDIALTKTVILFHWGKTLEGLKFLFKCNEFFLKANTTYRRHSFVIFRLLILIN